MGNPLDDYFESGEQKTAGLGDFAGAVGRGARGAISGEGLGQLATYSAAAAGAGALVGAARKAYMAATKGRHHKQMIEANPDLAEAQQADPTTFNQHYSSLRNLNPVFASDPVVAGAYMRRMSEFPHNAGPILVESLKSAPQPPGVKDYATALDISRSAGQPAMRMEQARLQKTERESARPDRE